MKLISVNEIAISDFLNNDRVKLTFLKEKWKSLGEEIYENSSVIDFREDTIFIKTTSTVVNHYIFANKHILIKKILDSIEDKFKFKIVDIKVFN